MALTTRSGRALTGDAFAGLLAFLDADAERAAAEYERLRQRLMKLFRWRGCLAPEEYADATLDRVARMLADGVQIHSSNKYAVVHGVALNLLREHWRDADRQRKALDSAPAPRDPERPDEALSRIAEAGREAARVRCLQRCLRRMPDASRSLIRRYYAEGDVLDKAQRKQIAGELGISVNTLRVRAHRIRSEVGRCVESCLEREPS
jgi:DNA-directed RNA polymerase specialized sigma24 family protein